MYVSDLDDEVYFDAETPPFFAVPIPIQYLIDMDDNLDDRVRGEYFMNFRDVSFIKNQLDFILIDTAP